MRKNALRMRRMRKLVNYADLHHRILSDALLRRLTEKHMLLLGANMTSLVTKHLIGLYDTFHIFHVLVV